MFETVISALNEGFVQTLKLFFITLVGSIPLGLIICFGSMNRWAPLGAPGRRLTSSAFPARSRTASRCAGRI